MVLQIENRKFEALQNHDCCCKCIYRFLLKFTKKITFRLNVCMGKSVTALTHSHSQAFLKQFSYVVFKRNLKPNGRTQIS